MQSCCNRVRKNCSVCGIWSSTLRSFFFSLSFFFVIHRECAVYTPPPHIAAIIPARLSDMRTMRSTGHPRLKCSPLKVRILLQCFSLAPANRSHRRNNYIACWRLSRGTLFPHLFVSMILKVDKYTHLYIWTKNMILIREKENIVFIMIITFF